MAAVPGFLLLLLHAAGHMGGGTAALRALRRAPGDSGRPGRAGAKPRLPGRGERAESVYPRGRGPGSEAGTGAAGSVFPTAQGFLSRNTRGRGYWLGLRAVRKVRRIQGYQWVDGVALSFR